MDREEWFFRLGWDHGCFDCIFNVISGPVPQHWPFFQRLGLPSDQLSICHQQYLDGFTAAHDDEVVKAVLRAYGTS